MEDLTENLWEYKTTPGSDHELCTVYVKGGKAVARSVTKENAFLIVQAYNGYHMYRSFADRHEKELKDLKKQRNLLIEQIAKLVQDTKYNIWCECEQNCSCADGLISPHETADAIRKLKEKV